MVRLTQGTEHAFHFLPTHLAIDQWVNDYIPQKQLRPYIANTIKTGEDMGTQMVADPTTYIPLVGEASDGGQGAADDEPALCGDAADAPASTSWARPPASGGR